MRTELVRARWRWVAALAGVVACDTRAGRIEQICEAVIECSGFSEGAPPDAGLQARRLDETSCRDELDDAARDGRLTPRELTRCAECTRRHDGISPRENENEDDCKHMLRDRDCDEACSAVDFVLKTRTGPETRALMCRQIEGSLACGAPQALDRCDGALVAAYLRRVDLDARLMLDTEVHQCASCLSPLSLEKPAPADRSQGGPTDAGVEVCRDLVENCQASCANVASVSARLEYAMASLDYCDKVRACPVIPGEPLAGPSNPRACFDELSELDDPADVLGCARCARALSSCDDVLASCKICNELQLAQRLCVGREDTGCTALDGELKRARELLAFCAEVNSCPSPDAGVSLDGLDPATCVERLVRGGMLPNEPSRRLCQPLRWSQTRYAFCEVVAPCAAADAGAPASVTSANECLAELSGDDERASARQACIVCARGQSDCRARRENCPECAPFLR